MRAPLLSVVALLSLSHGAVHAQCTPEIDIPASNVKALDAENGALLIGHAAGGLQAVDVHDLASGTYLFSLVPSVAPQAGDGYGEAISHNGAHAVVGARGQAHGAGVGHAFLFEVATGTELAVLQSPTPGLAQGFGASVAMSDEYALVGEPDRGLAHLFDESTGAALATLDASAHPAHAGLFGREVALGTVFDDSYPPGQELRQTAAVTSDSAVFLFDVTDPNQTFSIAPPILPPVGHACHGASNCAIYPWHLSMDGEWLALGTSLVLHNVLTGQTTMAPEPNWIHDSQTPALRIEVRAGRIYVVTFRSITDRLIGVLDPANGTFEDFYYHPENTDHEADRISVAGDALVAHYYTSGPNERVTIQRLDGCGPNLLCEGKISSNNRFSLIDFDGVPSLAQIDGFEISCATPDPNVNALLFYGLQGDARIPFFNGTLCVQPPLVRALPIGNSGQNHLAVFPFGDLVGQSAHAGLVTGAEVHAQIWFRDPTHPDGTGVSVSNALRFVLRP